MKINVTEDRTVRTISFEITDGPDLNDETATWRDKPRPFRAERARLVIQDGEVSSINVSGHLVLKGGRLSEMQSDSMTWAPDSFSRKGKLSEAPPWVRLIVGQAPDGVLSWELEGRA